MTDLIRRASSHQHVPSTWLSSTQSLSPNTATRPAGVPYTGSVSAKVGVPRFSGPADSSCTLHPGQQQHTRISCSGHGTTLTMLPPLLQITGNNELRVMS